MSPLPPLIDNKLQHFKVVTRLPQWIIWPAVMLLLLTVYFGAEQYFHWWTLTNVIPETTEVDSDGVVKQSTNFTCVPAAMTTMLLQQGIDVTQREVTDRLNTTIFGTYAWMIPVVGRHFGFEVTRESLDFDQMIASDDPLLLYNRFSEGLHVSYIPPGRLSPETIARLFAGHVASLLPLMDPVDGLVLVDAKGYVDYLDGGGPKTVFRFRHGTQPAQMLPLDQILSRGETPLLELGE
ncbi:MAG: hypothetical protein ABI743_07420 [bacterium]